MPRDGGASVHPWLRVQVGGVVLALVALALLALAYVRDARWGAGLSAAMLAELVTGREVAIPLALVTGIPSWMVAATSIAQNLALAALLVPVARQALAFEQSSFAGRFMQGLHDVAAARLPQGRSAAALFVFMLVPFVANGPVLAGLIGALAGMPLRRLAAAVVPAVVLTATAWTYAYAALADALARVDDRLALLPAALAAAVTILWLATATRRALVRQ